MDASEAYFRLGRRRDFLAGLLTGAGTLLVTPPLCGQPSRDARNVLEDIPSALHDAIRRRTIGTDLEPYFDRSARTAIARGQALFVPQGTYTMLTWSPPPGLVVHTDGRGTVFKQLDTRGRPQRFIEIQVDGVALWPGGSATIDGGMEVGGVNATQFNSGVRVHARAGRRIDAFVCGDIYGVDIGGDVLETGCEDGGFLGRCTIGTIYGDNVYRNVLSVTGGRSGTVAGVFQTGGCGFLTLDFEPDPSSAEPGAWTVGAVRGHRIAVAGDPSVPIGSVVIRELVLDHARASSSPPFNSGGVSRAAMPTLFKVGMRYRNTGSIRVDRATFVGFPRAAIEDIGSGASDGACDRVSFGSLEIRDCGAETGYQVATQKTRLFEVGSIQAVSKRSPEVATFIGGNRMNLIRVNGGRIAGRAVFSAEGGFEGNNLRITGMSEPLFRLVRGPIRLRASVLSGAAAVFENCRNDNLIEDSQIEAARIVSGATAARIRRTRVNAAFYEEAVAGSGSIRRLR